jgi:anti-anti-sigma factor
MRYLRPTMIPMPAPIVDLEMVVSYGSADESTVRLREGQSTGEELDRQIAALVETRPSKVTIDLGALPRVSSAGLGLMLTLRRNVADYAGEVRVASVSPTVGQLFRRTGLDVLFDVEGREVGVA